MKGWSTIVLCAATKHPGGHLLTITGIKLILNSNFKLYKITKKVSKSLVLIFALQSFHWHEQLFLSRNLNLNTFSNNFLYFLFLLIISSVQIVGCLIMVLLQQDLSEIKFYFLSQPQLNDNTASTQPRMKLGLTRKLLCKTPPTPTHSQTLDRSLQESPCEHSQDCNTATISNF